jgi:hypothetical protein
VPRGRRRNRWIGRIESCVSSCRSPREDQQTLSPASSPSRSRKSGPSKPSSRTGEAPAPISVMKWSPGPIPMATRCCLPPHHSQSTAVFSSLSYDPIADFAAGSLVSRFSLCRTRYRPNRSWSSWPDAKAHPGKLCRSSVRGHRSEIMFGVLVVVFCPDGVAALGFSLGERQIPLIVSLRVVRALLFGAGRIR